MKIGVGWEKKIRKMRKMYLWTKKSVDTLRLLQRSKSYFKKRQSLPFSTTLLYRYVRLGASKTSIFCCFWAFSRQIEGWWKIWKKKKCAKKCFKYYPMSFLAVWKGYGAQKPGKQVYHIRFTRDIYIYIFFWNVIPFWHPGFSPDHHKGKIHRGKNREKST